MCPDISAAQVQSAAHRGVDVLHRGFNETDENFVRFEHCIQRDKPYRGSSVTTVFDCARQVFETIWCVLLLRCCGLAAVAVGGESGCGL
jgi:hypothetical protein